MGEELEWGGRLHGYSIYSTTPGPLTDLPTTTEGAANHLGGTLRSTGQIDPILLEEHPDGIYTIHAHIYTALTEHTWALLLLGRHNRAPNPIDEARHLQHLARTLTPEAITAHTGLPLQTVRARLQLAQLPADLLDLVGTPTLKLGTAHALSRLRDPFLGRAITAVRTAHAHGKPFGSKDLKAITTARRQGLAALLSTAHAPMPTLIPQAPLLAQEVRDLAQRRGVPLEDLLQELMQPETMPGTLQQIARVNLR